MEKYLAAGVPASCNTRARFRRWLRRVEVAFPAHVMRQVPYGDLGYAYLIPRTSRERLRQQEARAALGL